jgi:hypothetical protein
MSLYDLLQGTIARFTATNVDTENVAEDALLQESQVVATRRSAVDHVSDLEIY